MFNRDPHVRPPTLLAQSRTTITPYADVGIMPTSELCRIPLFQQHRFHFIPASMLADA
jgi:hypothetical protein